MPHTIRVRILKRDFSLVVQEEDEPLTRRLAQYVDERIQEFRRAHPDQPEVTAAVIAALAIAEEYFTERDTRAALEAELEHRVESLEKTLEDALEDVAEPDGASGTASRLD